MTTTTVQFERSAFPVVTAALLLTLAWLLAWYWPTADQIAGIWQRSDTYAHGMIVLPVFAWLVWRKRDAIAPLHLQPQPWMAVPIAAIGFVWLLSQMININGLAHFSLIAMIVLSFAAVLGLRLSRLLLFPLLFLFFAMPIGEFMLDTLMHYTAEFTVFALRLSGVPVYQEGLYFIIPNGRWSVVEACSGLRYMVASLFVGALYAYLNYVTLKRRLLFMLVALLVPIVANWVRAYLTVMIGYQFGNEFVQGFIHIVYGWVFFGIVIVLMFWIGSRWREDVQPVVSAHAMPAQVTAPSAQRWFGVLPVALVTAAFPLMLQVIDQPVEPFSVNLQAPPAAQGWQAVDDTVLDFMPNYNGHRGELFQAYRRDADGVTIGLYVAYYAQQRENAEMIAWENRLLGREGVSGWLRLGMRGDRLPTGPAAHFFARRDDRTRISIWHWYWNNRQVVASDVLAKIILALDRVTLQPDDAAFVAVYAAYIDNPTEVREAVEDFLAGHGDGLESTLQRARER